MLTLLRLLSAVMLTALLASACFRYTLEIDFNEDGSGTVRLEATLDLSQMPFFDSGDSPVEDCARVASNITDTDSPESFLDPGDYDSPITQVLPDGRCWMSITGRFAVDEFASREESAEFSVTDDGWEVVLPGSDDQFPEDEATVANLIAFAESGLAGSAMKYSIRLPGRPTKDHNAHRIEDGRFIWEFEGEELLSLPSEFRAASTSATNSYAWIVLIVVGSIMLLGVVYVVQNRRENSGTADQDDDDTPSAPLGAESAS